MKKRKSWIFVVFAILVVIGLSVVLVINLNKDDVPDYNSNQPTEIYATSFSVDLPSTIDMFIDSSVSFVEDYIYVEPAMAISKLEVELENKTSGVLTGITFENNTLTATEVGEYNLKFKMPKSKLTYFNKTVKIRVYDNKEVSHLYLKDGDLIINKSISVNEIFNFVSSDNYLILTDNKININSNVLTPNSLGASQIKIVYLYDKIEYLYSFNVEIKEQPRYEIILKNVSNNTIEIDLREDNVFTIQYQIIDRLEEGVSQDVEPISADESVVTAEMIMDQFVKVKALKTGQTKIVITSTYDTSIKIEIVVNVI